jgi:hypothetical protein
MFLSAVCATQVIGQMRTLRMEEFTPLPGMTSVLNAVQTASVK